jgi:hypothetical protein
MEGFHSWRARAGEGLEDEAVDASVFNRPVARKADMPLAAQVQALLEYAAAYVTSARPPLIASGDRSGQSANATLV